MRRKLLSGTAFQSLHGIDLRSGHSLARARIYDETHQGRLEKVEMLDASIQLWLAPTELETFSRYRQRFLCIFR